MVVEAARASPRWALTTGWEEQLQVEDCIDGSFVGMLARTDESDWPMLKLTLIFESV